MAPNLKEIYYTIGQVSALTELPQSVLRYWESVFENLKPEKSPGGSRQYSENDIETIKLIKSLLYEQGYTIKGAVNKLKSADGRDNLSIIDDSEKKKLNSSERQNIVKELKEIIRILES